VTLLSVSNVGISFGATELFKNITFTVAEGERWGIIGRNGAGKTTLLNLILGDRETETGKVEYSRSWRVSAVAQEAPAGPESLIDTVLMADAERTRLLAAEVANRLPRIATTVRRMLPARMISSPTLRLTTNIVHAPWKPNPR